MVSGYERVMARHKRRSLATDIPTIGEREVDPVSTV
jgi:hypothetical protein